MCDNRSQKQHHKKVQLNSCKNQCAAAQMPIFRMYVSSHALSMCLCLTKCPEKVRYIFGNSIYFYLFRLRRWSRYPFLVTWPFKHIFIHTHNMKHLAFIQNIHACRPRVWSSLFSRLIRWDLVSSNTNRNDLNQSCTIYSTVTLWMYRTQNWRRRKNIIKRNTHSAAWQM